jgi:hypothetical protein
MQGLPVRQEDYQADEKTPKKVVSTMYQKAAVKMQSSIVSPKRLRPKLQESKNKQGQKAYFLPGNKELGEFYPKDDTSGLNMAPGTAILPV